MLSRSYPAALASLVLGVSLAGCNDPTVIPVAPPGLEYQSVMPEPKEEAAEAIGETRTAMERPGVATKAPEPSVPTKPGESRTTASGLKYETLKEGTGDAAAWGKNVSVIYTGKLTDGTVFDSTDKPFSFLLGSGGVIKGWDEGVHGMKVGEVRRLIVPPELAYGHNSRGKIPADATLDFEVELKDIH